MEDKAFFCNEYANLEVNYGSEGKHSSYIKLSTNCCNEQSRELPPRIENLLLSTALFFS